MTDNDITNIMLEVPHSFSVNDKHFDIYQPSMGMVYINAQLLASIGIDSDMLQRNVAVEILRIVNTNRELCCKYIAYNTFNKKTDILNVQKVNERAEYFSKNLEAYEIALLFLQINNAPSITDCTKKLNIAEDKQLMQRVQRAKKNTNTFIFGGKSIYGAVIGTAIEKFHWTYDYVIWGISYLNLQLLMQDSVSSIYLTDEERKSACIAPPNTKKIRVTAENLAELKKHFT